MAAGVAALSSVRSSLASAAVRTSNPDPRKYSANPSRVSSWSSTTKHSRMRPALQGPLREKLWQQRSLLDVPDREAFPEADRRRRHAGPRHDRDRRAVAAARTDRHTGSLQMEPGPDLSERP